MFDSYPTYSPFRTLMLTTPQQHGEDVYALQRALNHLGANCGTADGILGPRTSTAIMGYQTAARLIPVDAKAGGLTQKQLAMDLARAVSIALEVPLNAFKGQLELESGYRLGNYSALRPDHTYDAGVAQRNTKFTNPKDGFDPMPSIRALGDVVREHFVLFEGLPTTRRWALAQGAWNAPAFACYIAREEGAHKVTTSMVLAPTTAQRETFETYVHNASVYLV